MSKSRSVLAGLLLSGLALTACANTGGGGDGGDGLSGVIEIDGSSTVFPITEAVAEEFKIENPGVDITVGESGTGGGFEKFCGGETDLSDASRPIEADEAAACEAAGIEYVELTVAQDGLAIVVHAANDWVDCLTVEELAAIWSPDSAVDSWDDIRPEFPATDLTLYGPGTDSGTFDYFTDVINGEEGASRSDYTASENDNILVRGVQEEEGALGYFGFAYYAQNPDTLKVLGVDAGDGCVIPSDETVQDGTYAPLARPLYVYVKAASAAKPEIAAFVEFYLDNVAVLASEVGYTRVADDTLAASRDAFTTIL